MTRTVKPLKGRTFKCFPAVIELRAYIPSVNVSEFAATYRLVRTEMEESLGINRVDHMVCDGAILSEQVTICSNRAGLHLAYLHTPEDGSNRGSSCLVENANCGYEQAIGRLKKAGWKECKGA